MRAFVIVDASKRKARPIGALFWQPCAATRQGAFSLELSSQCTARTVPLSLMFCLNEERRCASAENSRDWVRSRIVPEDRHNIAEVLAANGLDEYSEVDLLAACMGRSSDDDFAACEVALPDSLQRALAAYDVSAQDAKAPFGPGVLRADALIAATKRQRLNSKVVYAAIVLPDAPYNAPDDGQTGGQTPLAEGGTVAWRIGRQVRSARLEAGLTQKQLAARAGITQTVLSRVESGKGNPTCGLVEEIAEALGMQVDVSFSAKQPSQKPA